MHASALPVSRASCPWAGRSPTRPCAPRCAHLLLFPWLRVPLRWRCSCPRALRAGIGSLGDCRGGLRAAAARVGHQKECCRVVGFVRRGEETGRHGWRLRAGRECPNRPPARGGSAAPVLGVLAHAWLRGAVRSVQPSAACARISVQGADGGGKLWLCCAGDMWLHVMHGDQIWGLHTLLCALHRMGVKMPAAHSACLKVRAAPRVLTAVGSALGSAVPRPCARLCFVPCGAVCATRGCVPALIQSRDAIGSTSAPEIWDSAGRISAVQPSRKAAQPVWPWESVPVASVVTDSSYSGCAFCCQLPELSGCDPMGHVP